MDPRALYEIFHNSFNPNQQLRTAAEEQIQKLIKVPESLPVLLQIVGARAEVPENVRLAASLSLKNMVKDSWAPRRKKDGIFSDDHKNSVRNPLVENMVVETHNPIKEVLVEACRLVAYADYPDKWPEIVPFIVSAVSASLQSGDVIRATNALLLLRKLVKRYEYKKDQEPMLVAVRATFPILQPLAQSLVVQDSLEAAMALKIILKIFWSATAFNLPTHVTEIDFGSWFQIIIKAVEKELMEPAEVGAISAAEAASANGQTGGRPVAGIGVVQPFDADDKERWVWWKVKKWGCQILTRIFQRYGNADTCSDEYKAFAKAFSQDLAPKILNPFLALLSLRPSNKFCPDRVVKLCLSYLNASIEVPLTYNVLKPQLPHLLQHVIFPLLASSPQDIATFESDPGEYLRRLYTDFFFDYFSPSVAAQTLVTDLVKSHTTYCMPLAMELFEREMNTYKATEESYRTELEKELERRGGGGGGGVGMLQGFPPQPHHVRKDGLMVLLHCLQETLSKRKYRGCIQSVLVGAVFSEFTSPIPLLRSRVCWLVQTYAKELNRLSTPPTLSPSEEQAKTASGAGSPGGSGHDAAQGRGMVVAVVQAVLGLLRDPCSVVVRSQAALALQSLIDIDVTVEMMTNTGEFANNNNNNNSAASGVGLLSRAMEDIFSIMQEVGSDIVIGSLQRIIEKFSDSISPYAVQLVQQLAQSFVSLSGEAESLEADGDDDAADEASTAGNTCLHTISTVLNAVPASQTAKMFPQIEQILCTSHNIGNNGDNGGNNGIGGQQSVFGRILNMPLNLDRGKQDQQQQQQAGTAVGGGGGGGSSGQYLEDGLEILTYLTFYSAYPQKSPAEIATIKQQQQQLQLQQQQLQQQQGGLTGVASVASTPGLDVEIQEGSNGESFVVVGGKCRTGCSPLLWSVFPQIVHAFHCGGYDNFDDMISPLDNFIAKGPEVFMQSVWCHPSDRRGPHTYPNLVLGCVFYAFVFDPRNDRSAARGCQLLLSVLHNTLGVRKGSGAGGPADAYLGYMIDLVLARLAPQPADIKQQFKAQMAAAAHYNGAGQCLNQHLPLQQQSPPPLYLTQVYLQEGFEDEEEEEDDEDEFGRKHSQEKARDCGTNLLRMLHAVLHSCIFYNPRLALDHLLSRGDALRMVLGTLGKELALSGKTYMAKQLSSGGSSGGGGDGGEDGEDEMLLVSYRAKKLASLAALSLMHLRSTEMAPVVSSFMVPLFQSVLPVLHEVRHLDVEAENGNNEDEEEDEEDDDEEEESDEEEYGEEEEEDADIDDDADDGGDDGSGGGGGDDEIIDLGEVGGTSITADQVVKSLTGGTGKKEIDWMQLLGGGDELEREDEDDYTSDLDGFDLLPFFASLYQSAATAEPAVYSQLHQQLPPQTRAICEELMGAAAAAAGGGAAAKGLN